MPGASRVPISSQLVAPRLLETLGLELELSREFRSLCLVRVWPWRSDTISITTEIKHLASPYRSFGFILSAFALMATKLVLQFVKHFPTD